METNEKKIKALTETIVESIVSFYFGEELNLLLNSEFKSIAKHLNYFRVRELITEHLQNFDGKMETTEEWKKLNDFRIKLIEL